MFVKDALIKIKKFYSHLIYISKPFQLYNHRENNHLMIVFRLKIRKFDVSNTKKKQSIGNTKRLFVRKRKHHAVLSISKGKNLEELKRKSCDSQTT